MKETRRDPELAHWLATVERLPLTLQPSLNEQLSQWEMLFPFERKQVESFLRGADSFTPAELAAATANLRAIEAKMGVAQWNFSRTVNSMENSGELARSQYYGAWRATVKDLFAEIDARARPTTANEPIRNRLIIVVLPAYLPFNPANVWDAWQEQGRAVMIEGDSRRFFELVTGGQGKNGIQSSYADMEPTDRWLIDAGAKSGSEVQTGAAGSASCLNCEVLNSFREKFLADLNTIPRDTHTASDTMNTLRARDWSAYWPAELAGQDRLKNFVVELFLSGNGSLIFSNAFVQWASSEVLRRARPRVLVARFGMRAKPKPFTGIAIFENQSKVSTIPDADDPENSALDAGILARYVWLSALRYPEYERALCVCVAEHLNSTWIVAPPGSELEKGPPSISSEALYRALTDWQTS